MNLCAKLHNQGALRRHYMERINALALKNKTLLMKFSLLALIMTFSVILKARDGHGQDLDKMTVAIELKDVTLKQSLRVIESLTKLAFTYKTNDLAGYRISDYSRKDIAVSKLLNELLEHTDLKYEQVNDNIIIKKINDAPETTSAATSNQSVPDGGIRGRIINEKGEAIPQASITVVGGSKGAAANEQGDFSLADLKAGKYKVQISAVGYLPETREIVVKDNESVELNITLHEDNSRLTDIVVTALGIKREQKTLGYASQQVTGAQLTQSNQPNLINALPIAEQLGWEVVERHDKRSVHTDSIRIDVETDSGVTSVEGAVVLGKVDRRHAHDLAVLDGDEDRPAIGHVAIAHAAVGLPGPELGAGGLRHHQRLREPVGQILRPVDGEDEILLRIDLLKPVDRRRQQAGADSGVLEHQLDVGIGMLAGTRDHDTVLELEPAADFLIAR